MQNNLLAVIVAVSVLFLTISGAAAQGFSLTTTDDPKDFVEDFLDDIVKDGVPPFRAFFTRLGNTSPQLEATLSIAAKRKADQGKRYGKIIETVDASGVLKQVYGFGFFW